MPTAVATRVAATIMPVTENTPRIVSSKHPYVVRRSSSNFYQRSSIFDGLPLELHAEIFSYCLPPYPQISHDGSPMYIAQVCRAWRALANSTPRLWSSFEIEVEDVGPEDEDATHATRILSQVKLWLQLSKNHPLSLRLIHAPTGRIPNTLSARLLAMFVLQARRWRHVAFIVPSMTLASVQHLLPEDFPTLKSLTLHMNGVWNSLLFDFHALKLRVPWSQLTELDLRLDRQHLLNLDEVADLLSSATSLTACRVNARCTLTSQPAKRERLVLPSLKSLHLILQGGAELDSVNPVNLTTPHSSAVISAELSLTSFLGLFAGCDLTHLGLNWLVDGDRPSVQQWASIHSEFVSFLKDLSPSLHSLELTYLPLGEDGLLQCLAQLPGLKSLDLRFSLADQVNDPVTDRILQSLTLPGPQHVGGGGMPEGTGRKGTNLPQADQRLVPKLVSLHLQCTGVHCTEAALLKCVRSRGRDLRDMHAPSGLQHLQFHSMRQVVDRPHRRVEELLDLGLDATIDSMILL